MSDMGVSLDFCYLGKELKVRENMYARHKLLNPLPYSPKLHDDVQ